MSAGYDDGRLRDEFLNVHLSKAERNELAGLVDELVQIRFER